MRSIDGLYFAGIILCPTLPPLLLFSAPCQFHSANCTQCYHSLMGLLSEGHGQCWCLYDGAQGSVPRWDMAKGLVEICTVSLFNLQLVEK